MGKHQDPVLPFVCVVRHVCLPGQLRRHLFFFLFMVCPAPPLRIKHEGSMQFSTPADCRLLFDCCLPAVSLYKMGDLSFTSTPSRCDLSMTSGDEESDSSSPQNMLRKATVKTTRAASLSAPLPTSAAVLFAWSAAMASCLWQQNFPCTVVRHQWLQPLLTPHLRPQRLVETFPVKLG